jgi:A1 cistron-splicing factor AAR2
MDAITPAILLLNLPPSALGGMDLLSFTTTPKFRGIKDIPPGLHFVFVASTSTLSVRHGVWIKVNGPSSSSSSSSSSSASSSNPPDLFIRKWNASTEDLLPETDVATLLQNRANLGTIWRQNLTPYRQSASSQDTAATEESSYRWIQLTDCISEALLDRILNPNPEAWSLTSSSSANQDLDDIPGLSTSNPSTHEQELHFLPINLRKTWPEGATGRERTQAAQDRSWALKDLALRLCNNDINQVIGELQFCYAMILTLNNYSCLEQWRRLLGLVLTCSTAIPTNPTFFTHVLATLKLQLQHGQHVETALFDLTDDGATFLKTLLLRFKKTLDALAGNAHAQVVDELDDLLDYAHETLGWQITRQAGSSFARTGMLSLEDGEEVEMDNMAFDEEDEAGEYAPAIVDLSVEQMQALGIESVQLDAGAGAAAGNKTPNLRDRLLMDKVLAGRGGYQYEVLSDDGHDSDKQDVSTYDDDDQEEVLNLEDMDARY